MTANLPSLPGINQFMTWSWSQIEPYYADLESRPVGADHLAGWLADWSGLQERLAEAYARLEVAATLDTTDRDAEARFNAFVDDIQPKSRAADQGLKRMLLASGLRPPGFEIPLRKMQAEADLFREETLSLLDFWPYMAVVDAFQHWVYEHPQAAAELANCDARWDQLWGRFMRGVDWSGLEQEMMTGWQRKAHIHQDPFYYVEYGLAQLGAVQVWRTALRDQASALASYRRALSLGGARSLPDLYAAAGAKLAFDEGTLQEAVDLIEEAIEELEGGGG